MKLSVTEVKKGLVPFGPGVGSTAISVKFEETEGDFPEAEVRKDENGNELPPDQVFSNAKVIVSELMEKIYKAEIYSNFAKFLFGLEYVYFLGESITKPEWRNLIKAVEILLISTGFKIQETEFEKNKIPKETYEQKLIRPKINLVTLPEYYTGNDKFYANFDFVFCKAPLDSLKISEAAVVEIEKLNNTIFILEFTDSFEKEKETLKEVYFDKSLLSNPGKIFIVDESTSKSEDISNFAINNEYNLIKYSDYKVNLNF